MDTVLKRVKTLANRYTKGKSKEYDEQKEM